MDEYRRQLYVALTRARDELYICGYTTDEAPKPLSWYALIAASIMSKKLAEGLNGLVLDVKNGGGAFLPEVERGLELAKTMIALGEDRGCPTLALITAMDRPLGRACGNVLETEEAILALRGEGPPDLLEVTYALGVEMLIQGGIEKNTKKARNGNSRYARCKFEDLTGSVECVMWPDDYARFKEMVKEDEICFVNGVVERGRDAPGLVVTKILGPEEVQRQRTTGVVLSLSLERHQDQHIDAIARILKRSPGNVPVFLSITDRLGRRSLLKASSEYCINPNTLARADLETLLGPRSVTFSRHGNGSR